MPARPVASDAVTAPGRYRVVGEIFTFPMSPGEYHLEVSLLEDGDLRSCLGRLAAPIRVLGTPGTGTLRLHADWTVDAELA